ncbi:hypothetical protein, partial [Rhodothermus marinus]|uniref:hypothetical protein n=1 Tax=Rhodothermus marinus TaxID=29549 RepID=UPI001FB29878
MSSAAPKKGERPFDGAAASGPAVASEAASYDGRGRIAHHEDGKGRGGQRQWKQRGQQRAGEQHPGGAVDSDRAAGRRQFLGAHHTAKDFSDEAVKGRPAGAQ